MSEGVIERLHYVLSELGRALAVGPIPGELVAGIRAVAMARNLVDAAEAELLSRAEEARRQGAFGAAAVVDILADSQPITGAEARRRVARADTVTPGRTLRGDPVPPIAHVLAAAMRRGVISAQHADIVIRTLDRVPDHVDHSTVEIVEKTLVDAAEHVPPPALASMGDAPLQRLDQDGAEPTQTGQDPKRGLRRSRRRDGGIRWVLDTDALGDATLAAVLSPLAAPNPASDDEPDQRSATQRNHDALLEACGRLLRSGSLPASGGVPTTVLVTVTLRELLARAGLAATERGGSLPVPDLLAACSGEAAFLPAVFDDDGAVLQLGRTQRLASPAQRRALAARDGGCCFPGCDRPPAWSEVHHVAEWTSARGPTDIDNLVLLCGRHHRRFTANGWRLRMTGAGVPEWTPPPWLDPLRRPRRNRAHDRPAITFGPPGRDDTVDRR